MIFHLYIQLLIFTFYKYKEPNMCSSNIHLQNDSKVIISLYYIYNNLNLGRLTC